ncbi:MULTISPECIES: excalibur calcium-binding domain-containing protein [Gammaproteobacteria]|nr:MULTISPECIES: excalibur calcium-binding domain-containing protein [unclassified Psychrobacter]
MWYALTLVAKRKPNALSNAKKAGYTRLDRDKDGIACEALR